MTPAAGGLWIRKISWVSCGCACGRRTLPTYLLRRSTKLLLFRSIVESFLTLYEKEPRFIFGSGGPSRDCGRSIRLSAWHRRKMASVALGIGPAGWQPLGL